MQKKLTISVAAAVYDGLYRTVGAQRISQFIQDLVRPHVLDEDLVSAYAEMAAEETRETDAQDWADSLISDVGDEAR